MVKLVLFGSRARGDNDPDSDYDVLVVLKGHVNPFNESRFAIDTTAEIGLKYAVTISCIYASDRRFEDDKGLLIRNIRNQGRAICRTCQRAVG